jgi:hypothetical protein
VTRLRHKTFLLVVPILLSACSNDLSRSEASATLDRQFEQPGVFNPLGRTTSLLVKTGRMGRSCKAFSATIGGDSSTQLLRVLGYLDVKPDGRFFNVTVTPRGQAFLHAMKETAYAHETDAAGCDYQQLTFPYGVQRLKNITGITRNQNTSKVDFSWKWELNQLGTELVEGSPVFTKLADDSRLQDLPIPKYEVEYGGYSSAVFTLYDDGWRLERGAVK